MYNTSLYYQLKYTLDKKKVLGLFFQNWADSICNEEVVFETVCVDYQRTLWNETIRVDFMHPEDASIMKLQGVPPELEEYLQLVD